MAAIMLERSRWFGLSLITSHLDWRERAAAAWFGPKGFASVVYGLLVLESRTGRAEQLFALVAVAVTASIVAHSSTDVLIARWFVRAEQRDPHPP